MRQHSTEEEAQVVVDGGWTHGEAAEAANKAHRAFVCSEHEPESTEGLLGASGVSTVGFTLEDDR